MATVTFSKGWLSQSYNRQTSSVTGYHFTKHGTEFSTYLKLMSGTIPTDFTTLTMPTALGSQTLWRDNITYSVIDTPTIDHGGVSLNDSFEINQTTYTAAQRTDTAQWFWLYQTNNDGNYPDDGSGDIRWQMIGTVGTTGTDLILPSASIVSGRNYRISGLGFKLSQDYTY